MIKSTDVTLYTHAHTLNTPTHTSVKGIKHTHTHSHTHTHTLNTPTHTPIIVSFLVFINDN